MTHLIIDTSKVLDHFKPVAELFDFYPNGITGLVTYILSHHFQFPDADQHCDLGVHKHVLDKYHESPHYQVYIHDVEGWKRQQSIEVMLFMVYEELWEFMRYNRKTLVNCSLRPDTVQLGVDMEYLLLERD